MYRIISLLLVSILFVHSTSFGMAKELPEQKSNPLAVLLFHPDFQLVIYANYYLADKVLLSMVSRPLRTWILPFIKREHLNAYDGDLNAENALDYAMFFKRI